MTNARLPIAVCAAVAEVLQGSHATLDALFLAAGAPGPPPDLAHHSKWKTWLRQASTDPNVDSLSLVGNLIEEFMDLPPTPGTEPMTADFLGIVHDPVTIWQQRRDRLNQVFAEHGLQYFRGGQVLPTGDAPRALASQRAPAAPSEGQKPSSIEGLLETLVRGLPRAMHPLTHRRKGSPALSFDTEWDIQDLLHSHLRTWIADIRPEEFTPSYAGSSTRMDFLLPRYAMVLETKRVRDKAHAGRLGDELIIDIEHYRRHPRCDHLWCIIYDPAHLVQNPASMTDLEGIRSTPDGRVQVRVFLFTG